MAQSKARQRQTLDINVVSLMWPTTKPTIGQLPTNWAADLHLDDLIRAFELAPRYTNFIRQTLISLTTDVTVISWRQAVLNDFLRNPELVDQITNLLPRFTDLNMGHALFGRRQRSVLLETTDRLSELDLYLSVIQELYAALQSADVASGALRQLRANLLAIINNENFQSLRDELPKLQRPLQNFASLAIGINLDSQLQPVSAVLLGINEHPFGEMRSFLSKILGTQASNNDDSGIAPLHFTPGDPDQRPLSPLFQDLEKLINQTVQPIARSLARYVRISSGPLAGLENELAFFAAAVKLIQRLQQRGITFCQPEIVPSNERVSQIDGLININLAIRALPSSLVANDLVFDDQGRIALLTGPNSGGKTTYLQSVGLAYAMFQAGLFIPANKARLSPIDFILTHFPTLETQQGRLSEEAARLRDICIQATDQSLVLLNESLSSTTASEALYLAHDILCGLRVIGVRAIFATHLVELVAHIPEMEATITGISTLYSLVAGVYLDETAQARPTYKIQRGAPLGRSYAQEIARRHGISLDQILAARKKSAE